MDGICLLCCRHRCTVVRASTLDIDALNGKFGIADRVQVMPGEGGLPMVTTARLSCSGRAPGCSDCASPNTRCAHASLNQNTPIFWDLRHLHPSAILAGQADACLWRHCRCLPLRRLRVLLEAGER